jgi:hypothetical protein
MYVSFNYIWVVALGTSTEPEHFITPGTTNTAARLMKIRDILRALVILFESFI